MTQSAQTKARTLLAHSHHSELREMYLYEKASTNRSLYKKASHRNAVARGRALSRLVTKYFMEYTVLYELCVLQGFSRHSFKRGRNS
jgi:hypothetical protein